MKPIIRIFSVLLFSMAFITNTDAQIVYQESMTGPVNAATVTKWNNFRAALTPRTYNKLVIYNNNVKVDEITNAAIVQDMAKELNLAPATGVNPPKTWNIGTYTWWVGECGNSVEFGARIGGALTCNCTPGKVIRTACVGCGNNFGSWLAAGNGACPSPNPFNVRVEFWFGFPCVDTPRSSVKAPTQVCPNKSYEVAPDSLFADADYDWEYSRDGISWSKFTGVPGQRGEIIDSFATGSKYYRVTITCQANNGLKYTSPPHKVSIAPFYYCYCDNRVEADTGANIGNVTIINSSQLDTILNKAQLVTGTGLPVFGHNNATNMYTPYHDSLSFPCLYRDTSYIFDLSQIHSGNSFIRGVLQAYIDYNRDGVYNPNTERIFVKAMDGLSNPPQKYRVNNAIPSSAATGPTGMRIILSEDTVQGGPCGLLSGAGEVEDYIVEICERPCNAPVNAGIVVSTDTSMCGGYEYTLADTTYEKKRSGFDRAWQLSGDNVTWTNISNSLNKDTLERVFTGQPLYYRLRTICGPTHDTNYSQPTLINVKPSYKCYCYSKALGGKFSDTSDIGGVTIAGYSSNSGGPHLLNKKAVLPRTDFTDITPIEMFADSLYDFYVYHTMSVVEHGDAKVTVFMDFNNNHEYDIPEERIYTGYTSIGNHTMVDNVLIPYNAITDVPTGMRVIINNDVGPNIPSDEACGGYISGETEDYILVFRRKWAANVNETIKLGGFNVHPNPTTGKFYVQFQTNSMVEDVEIRVTSVAGQVISQHSYKHDKGMFNQELDMSNQPAGVYFVELQADGQKLMKKLIIQ